VFIEAKLASGPQDPRELRERPALLGHAAQDPRDDDGVHRRVGGGEVLGVSLDDVDRDRRSFGLPLGPLPEGRIRLDREEAPDGRRVVTEVDAAADADLEHLPAQAIEQPATMLGAALPLRFLGRPRLVRGEPSVATGSFACASHGEEGYPLGVMFWFRRKTLSGSAPGGAPGHTERSLLDDLLGMDDRAYAVSSARPGGARGTRASAGRPVRRRGT
jgi:hypothetical protein